VLRASGTCSNSESTLPLTDGASRCNRLKSYFAVECAVPHTP
jgi:hypothetical protein